MKVLVQDFKNHLDTSVASAINKKVAGEGGINMGVLQKALDKLKEDIMGKIKTGVGENDILFKTMALLTCCLQILLLNPQVNICRSSIFEMFLNPFVFPKRSHGLRDGRCGLRAPPILPHKL